MQVSKAAELTQKLISNIFRMNKFIINHFWMGSGTYLFFDLEQDQSQWHAVSTSSRSGGQLSQEAKTVCVCVVLLLSLPLKNLQICEAPLRYIRVQSCYCCYTAVCRPTWSSPICIQSSVLFPRHAWSPPFILEGFSIDHVAAAANTVQLYQF